MLAENKISFYLKRRLSQINIFLNQYTRCMHIRIKKIISFEIYPSSRAQYYGEEIEVCVDKIRWATKMCSDGHIVESIA